MERRTIWCLVGFDRKFSPPTSEEEFTYVSTPGEREI
jgi:hypothetical protein